MAFGKVVVYSASGDVEEHELTRPTTSVGRQPGNDIVLKTSAVSRYHAQFDVAEGKVLLVDLGTVNGSFVNEEIVEPNSSVALNDGDTIMMGDILMRFHSPEARSGGKFATTRLTPEALPVEQEGLDFRLVLDEPQQSVAPGARLQLALILENLSDEERTLVIDVGGLDQSWIKLNRREALLSPHEETQVLISVRPPRASETAPGVYALVVRVAHQDDATMALEAVREIDVVGYAGLGVVARPSRQSGLYHVAVQNQGNIPASLQMEGFHPESLLQYDYSPKRLTLDAGETQQVSLTVEPADRQTLSPSEPVPFAVVATSLDKAGYEAPVLTYYTPTSGGGGSSRAGLLAAATIPLLLGAVIFVLALLAGAFYLGILDWPGEGDPPFGTIGPDEEDLATPAPPTAAPTQIPESTGPTPTLVPTPIAEILNFSAQPAQVTYNTSGTVSLSWEVDGVNEVALIDPFGEALPLTAANQSTSRYDIPIASMGYGDNTFQLTIAGDDNQDRSRTVVVQAIAHICEVTAGVPLFVGPDLGGALASPRVNDQVIVLGRTEDVLWLRVAYNDLTILSEQAWAQAEAVTCLGSAPPFDQYIVTDTGVVTPTEDTATSTP